MITLSDICVIYWIEFILIIIRSVIAMKGYQITFY